MKKKEVAKLVGKSVRHVERTLNDDSYKKHDLEKIVVLLDFETNTLPKIFKDPRFVDMCETTVQKSRRTAVREFAAYCKAISIYLRDKD